MGENRGTKVLIPIWPRRLPNTTANTGVLSRIRPALSRIVPHPKTFGRATGTLAGEVGTTLGSRGHTKVSYIHRATSDVVEDFFTVDGGATTVVGDGQSFGTFENRVFRNTDALKRSYDALQFQSRMQVTDDFLVDGSWTTQLRNKGNFEGEATNRPAISSPAFDYPEITPAARYYPTGRLDEFQQHKVRVWGIYSLDLASAGAVDVAGIWRYDSGPKLRF